MTWVVESLIAEFSIIYAIGGVELSFVVYNGGEIWLAGASDPYSTGPAVLLWSYGQMVQLASVLYWNK
ncbi:hypothetical protein EDC04DRAFT_2815054 [Pisolithus marmoratus]|nr:hypothetical protein EDC04DRAFT_2815054 [Pisolithus marmoratus]